MRKLSYVELAEVISLRGLDMQRLFFLHVLKKVKQNGAITGIRVFMCTGFVRFSARLVVFLDSFPILNLQS